MKITSALALLSLFFIFGISTALAQTPEKVNKKPFGIASIIKDTAREVEGEELPPPPPPPSSLREVSGEGFSIKPVDTINRNEGFYSDFPDTSAVPEDELTAEIRKLLELTSVIETGLQQANEKLQNLRLENEGELPEEFYDLLEKEFQSDFTKRMFENVTIRTYRKYFTVGDMKEFIKFYETDIGKKTLTFLPAILNESILNASSIGSMLGIKVFEQLETEGKIK